MAVEYTWFVSGLQVKDVEDKTDVVHKVDWRLLGVDGNEAFDAMGTVELDVSDLSGDFTSFEDLTQEQVTAWVEGVLGEDRVTSYKTSIEAQITQQKARAVLTVKAAPWNRIPDMELPPAPPIADIQNEAQPE